MSYIDKVLATGQSNPSIADFLIEEGFKKGDNPFELGRCMLREFDGGSAYDHMIRVTFDTITLIRMDYDDGFVIIEEYDFDGTDFDDFRCMYANVVKRLSEILF